MYRKLLYVISVLSLCITLLASCTGCSNSNKKKAVSGVESPVNPEVEKLDETPDEAILVKLDKFDMDSMYVSVAESGEKKAFFYREAKTQGLFHGSLKRGDTYSIFPDNSRKTATIVINTTELSGRWFYDQKQHRGIDFNEGGGMSSINSDKICFREWKLLNGKMYVYFVDMQQLASDRHQYQVEEAQIFFLSADKLAFKFHGQDYECSRPSDKPILIRPRI
jgi:hypothetical protein